MIKFLLLLKSKYSISWRLIEWLNGFLFGIFFRRRFVNLLHSTLEEHNYQTFHFKEITKSDLSKLELLLNTIEPGQATFFEPHGLTYKDLKYQLRNKGFLMMAAFDKEELVGYFFLRCGINKKCFLGRYIHPDYRNKGLGKTMNEILYQSAWSLGFRLFATFSKDNQQIFHAHKNNLYIEKISDLKQNYVLVEFKNQPSNTDIMKSDAKFMQKDE